MRRAKVRAKREADMVTDIMYRNFVFDGSNEVGDELRMTANGI